MFENVFRMFLAILSLMVGMLEMIFVAKYIFQENIISKRGIYVCSFMLCITLGVCLVWNKDISTLFAVFSIGFSLFLTRNKHRFRGFFLVIPILGISAGIILPFKHLKKALLSTYILDIVSGIEDFIVLVIFIIFVKYGKKWRINFEQELKFRKIGSLEKKLLISTGLIVILLYTIVGKLEKQDVLNGLDIYIIFIINITAFILTITIIGFVLRGNKGAYYEGIAKINEHYLELELQHFEAYKITQQEVRRIQHDMKNHMICLQHLCEQENIKEIQNYIINISEMLKSGDMQINCGNILASSICTHKSNVAKQKGIRLEVDGIIPENIELMSVDLCTILSNALDNAIEAVEEMEEKLRWIRMEVHNQGELMLFRFSNPVKKDINKIEVGVSTKNDINNHGFGLLNIKYTVEKYNGEMFLEIEENEVPEFVLSVIVGKRKN